MRHPTLFSYYARSIVGRPEVAATEALGYILRHSPSVQAVWQSLFAEIGIEPIPDNLRFRTEPLGDDRNRPDLVREDDAENPFVVIEAKFGADLTDSQSNLTYLSGSFRRAKVLLFVVPRYRFESIWHEVSGQCVTADLSAQSTLLSHDVRCGRIKLNPNQMVAIISWPDLLGRILKSLHREYDAYTCADLAQLQGLCEYMDEHPFQPFKKIDLLPRAGMVVFQLCGLVDKLAESIVRHELASHRRGRDVGPGWYGRKLEIGRFNCEIQSSSLKWAQSGPGKVPFPTTQATPLWFCVYHSENPNLRSHRIFQALQRSSIPWLEEDWDGYGLVTPLHVPTDDGGSSEQQVIHSLLQQIHSIRESLLGLPVDAEHEQPLVSTITE